MVTVQEANDLYKQFDKTKILDSSFIKLFNEIKLKNKFNPHKFSKNNINFFFDNIYVKFLFTP